MSLFPISTARGLIGQPVMAYNWEVVIPDPPSTVVPYVESLSVKARTVAIPGFVFTHPGRKEYPRRLDMRFLETYTKSVVEAMKLWTQQVFDEEAGAGIDESNLKANVWIRLLGPDPEGEQAIDGAIHVYEAFPISVANTTLGYNEDGPVMVNVSMAYNIWRWESWPF